MLTFIQPHFFFNFAYTHWKNKIDEFKDKERYRKAISYYYQQSLKLCKEEIKVAIKPTIITCSINGFSRKNTSEQHPSHTTNTMARKYIQCIVEYSFLFNLHSNVGNKRSNKSNKYTLWNSYKTCSR